MVEKKLFFQLQQMEVLPMWKYGKYFKSLFCLFMIPLQLRISARICRNSSKSNELLMIKKKRKTNTTTWCVRNPKKKPKPPSMGACRPLSPAGPRSFGHWSVRSRFFLFSTEMPQLVQMCSCSAAVLNKKRGKGKQILHAFPTWMMEVNFKMSFIWVITFLINCHLKWLPQVCK